MGVEWNLSALSLRRERIASHILSITFSLGCSPSPLNRRGRPPGRNRCSASRRTTPCPTLRLRCVRETRCYIVNASRARRLACVGGAKARPPRPGGREGRRAALLRPALATRRRAALKPWTWRAWRRGPRRRARAAAVPPAAPASHLAGGGAGCPPAAWCMPGRGVHLAACLAEAALWRAPLRRRRDGGGWLCLVGPRSEALRCLLRVTEASEAAREWRGNAPGGRG